MKLKKILAFGLAVTMLFTSNVSAFAGIESDAFTDVSDSLEGNLIEDISDDIDEISDILPSDENVDIYDDVDILSETDAEEITGVGTDVSDYLTVNGSGEITAYTGSGIKDIVIPNQVRGITITAIGNRAFYNKSDIESVQLPNTLVSIGNEAFENTPLGSKTETKTLIIPKSVTTVGYKAFMNCDYLGKVVFEDVDAPSLSGISFALYSEHNNMFENCDRLTDIRLSNNIKTVPASFAINCKELLKVEWGKI